MQGRTGQDREGEGRRGHGRVWVDRVVKSWDVSDRIRMYRTVQGRAW